MEEGCKIENIIVTFLRTIAVYLVVLAFTRIMGRKQLSQITFFNFVTGVTLGTITASAMQGGSTRFWDNVVILIALLALTFLAGRFSLKSFTARKWINSEPLTVIRNGQIVQDNMQKERYNLGDLMMHLRENGIFNIADVEFAILERDGKLSVLPKSQKQPLTPADLNIPTPYKGVMAELIIDGNILEENLKAVRLGTGWLLEELKKRNIPSPGEVLFCGLDTSGQLYISIRQAVEEEHVLE